MHDTVSTPSLSCPTTSKNIFIANDQNTTITSIVLVSLDIWPQRSILMAKTPHHRTLLLLLGTLFRDEIVSQMVRPV